MNKNEIDDLLKVVSPELITAYEGQNLDGKTLKEVNEEYKAVTQQTGMDLDDWIKLLLFSVFVGFMLAMYLVYKEFPWYISDASMAGIVLPPLLYLYFPARRKFKKDRETRYWCEPILRDFKQAVEALGMLDETTGERNESSIRHMLTMLASGLLKAEADFVIARRGIVPMQDVVNCGNWETRCREQLVKALGNVEKFGIVLNQAELFRSAKAQRTWEDEGCSM